MLNGDTHDTLDGFQMKKAFIIDYLLDGNGYIYIKKMAMMSLVCIMLMTPLLLSASYLRALTRHTPSMSLVALISLLTL